MCLNIGMNAGQLALFDSAREHGMLAVSCGANTFSSSMTVRPGCCASSVRVSTRGSCFAASRQLACTNGTT